MHRPGRFDAHANWFRQSTVESVGLAVLVLQTTLGQLSRGVVDHGDLLVASMKITSYNQHCSAPSFRALVASATKLTREKEPTTSSNQPPRSYTERAPSNSKSK